MKKEIEEKKALIRYLHRERDAAFTHSAKGKYARLIEKAKGELFLLEQKSKQKSNAYESRDQNG